MMQFLNESFASVKRFSWRPRLAGGFFRRSPHKTAGETPALQKPP
jgi:hypothetical protein